MNENGVLYKAPFAIIQQILVLTYLRDSYWRKAF